MCLRRTLTVDITDDDIHNNDNPIAEVMRSLDCMTRGDIEGHNEARTVCCNCHVKVLTTLLPCVCSLPC